jgi:hypothetical protein
MKRTLGILLLLAPYIGLAQFDLAELPEMSLREIDTRYHLEDSSIVAEILIDNQQLSFSGDKIANIQSRNKRILRIKIYDSNSVKPIKLVESDKETVEKLKIFSHSLTLDNRLKPKATKNRLYSRSDYIIDFEELGIQDGYIIDIYYETTTPLNENQITAMFEWNLVKEYSTKDALHKIIYSAPLKINVKPKYPGLEYKRAETNAQAGKIFNDGFSKSKEVHLTAQLKDVTSTQIKSICYVRGVRELPVESRDLTKFGNVSIEEIKMKVYESDSLADAVILYDHGKYDADNSYFTRHLKVKVLTKSGLSWGNWVFNTPTISDFKVSVFNIVNDMVVTDEIEKMSIFKENIVDDYYVYKVFAPNVKVGSVIDIEYSHPGIPYTWEFQHLIPVQCSELVFETDPGISFKKIFYGFETIETINDNTWRAEEMPAFQTEPYINYEGNYRTKFEFQLSRIGLNEISTTWQKINELLNESERFGSAMRQMSYLSEKAKELANSSRSDVEKINEAYSYIKENIKWNGHNSAFVSQGYRNNFKRDHNGNVAEINLHLVSLLKNIGIDAYPVVLSTKDNGLLMSFNASLRKLNYVVCYVKHGSIEILLDASQENLIPGILHWNSLNGAGWVVDEENGYWLDLDPSAKFKSKKLVQIVSNEDGLFKAKINQSRYQYSYLNWSDEVTKDKDQNNESYLLEKFPDLKILDYKLTKEDKENLISTESLVADLNNNIDKIAGEYFINPHILNSYKKNPFTSDTRKFPVDLNYPIEESETVLLQIPQGYNAINIPESLKLVGLNGDLHFQYLCERSGEFVNIQWNLDIKRSIFTENEYQSVKSFFSAISEKFDESINLRKL